MIDRDLMARYVLGELGDDEARELERLVRHDPVLGAEIAHLRRAFDLVGFDAVTPPPSHLRSRILDATARAAEPSPVPRAAEDARRLRAVAVRPRPMHSLARIVGAIAALLIVALGWDGYRLRQELQLQRDVATTLQQPNVVRQFALRGTGISLASGTVVLDLDAKRAAVAIRGLPKLPAGQVYRLWARIADGTVPCGQFNADANGAVTSQFTIPVDAYTSPVEQLFLNVEPAKQAAGPVGTTVMISTAA